MFIFVGKATVKYLKTEQRGVGKETYGGGEINLPAIIDRHNSGAIFGDLQEHWHGEVEMGPRGVAPPAIVVGKSVVGRTEVRGRHENGRASRVTPLLLIRALDLETRPAAESLVEQRRAQRRSVHPVTLTV